MEFLIAILLAGVFIGPTAYHFYERIKRPQKAKEAQAKAAKSGPSWGQRMLGMLVPVMILFVFLVALWVVLTFFVHV